MLRLLRFVVVVIGLLVSPATAQEVVHAAGPVVRAVLFFSPTCPHCRDVIRDHLPIFFQVYGGPAQVWTDESTEEAERYFHLLSNGRLEILLVNAGTAPGFELYNASMESHPVTPARGGVPRLIVGDSVLVGSDEIPAYFHDLIRGGLRGDGVPWPAVGGLDEVIGVLPVTVAEAVAAPSTEAADSAPGYTHSRADPAPTPTPAPSRDSTGQTGDSGAGRPDTAAPAPADSLPLPMVSFEFADPQPASLAQVFRRDPVGNGAAVAVLFGMLVSVLGLPRLIRFRAGSDRPNVAVPLVALVGVAVTAYLTYVEATGTAAVCGPVGDCNTVQQSAYAVLFGVLPVGALGLIGFVAIIAAWVVSAAGRGHARDWARLALFGMTVGGTLFSIYLTFLEPFVIGATCAWCLTAAITITTLMWLSAGAGAAAWSRLRQASAH